MKHRPSPRVMQQSLPVAEPAPPPKLTRTSQDPKFRAGGAGLLADTPLSVEVVDVTPDMAERWLEKNHPSNRAISWGTVEAFANDMRAGAWKLTHQAVCFDAEGYLIDGQHRLEAVKQAGVTVKLLVIKNQAGSFHDPIDRGRPRSVAMIMGVHGRVVSCLNSLRMCEVGYELHTPMTLNEGEAVAARHHEYLQAISTIPRTKLTGPFVAACVWALPVGKERVLEFATKVASGEMIGRGDPAFAFRSWRERNKRVSSWNVMLAAFNCQRHYLTEVRLASVYTGEAGYRAFCAQRRKLRISHTPNADMVQGGAWVPDGRRRAEEEDT